MKSNDTIPPTPLPWWRRLFGLGPSMQQIRADAEQKLRARIEELSQEKKGLYARHNAELRKLEEEWNVQLDRQKVLEARLEELERKRALAWPKPAVRMPRPQVLAEFAAPLDQGLQAALHQELDDYVQELVDQVAQPPGHTVDKESKALVPVMTNDQRLYLSGAIEHMRLFQKQLLDLHDEAGRKDAELEEKEGRE